MIIIAALAFVLVAVSALVVRAALKRKLQVWVPSYVRQSIAARPAWPDGPVDVLFCFVDHYEPGWNHVDYRTEVQRVDGWYNLYPKMAGEFADSDGVHPRHTWFYPPHYYRYEHLEKLVDLCLRGYGDIEMHLHHSRLDPFPDTSATLKAKILACIDTYSRFGIFETSVRGVPARRYAFVHGDWALDGSRPQFCGVNDELTILRDTGCYADFTFPAYMVESQPAAPNTIFYATDDPGLPNSHRHGSPVRVGGAATGDLLLVQGPLGIRWPRRRGLPIPKVDDGEVCANYQPSKERVDYWVRAGIHVQGRPEWVIVKVFTHGADLREHPVLLGDPIRAMHAHLQQRYNDGKRYRLHYVTARELFNIIKAAEAGRAGNPGQYRDFELQPYRYRPGGGQHSPRPAA